MIFLLLFSGIAVFLTALWLTLEQIIRYPIVGWQWEQMLQPVHHESTALVLFILAIVLFWGSFRARKRKGRNGKTESKNVATADTEVMERWQRIREVYLKES